MIQMQMHFDSFLSLQTLIFVQRYFPIAMATESRHVVSP